MDIIFKIHFIQKKKQKYGNLEYDYYVQFLLNWVEFLKV